MNQCDASGPRVIAKNLSLDLFPKGSLDANQVANHLLTQTGIDVHRKTALFLKSGRITGEWEPPE